MRDQHIIELERAVKIRIGLFHEDYRCSWVHALQKKRQANGQTEGNEQSTYDKLNETESREILREQGETAVCRCLMLVDLRAIRCDMYDIECDAL